MASPMRSLRPRRFPRPRRPASWRRRLVLCLLGSTVAFAPAAAAEEIPEYRLKAAILYNFALFTEWPGEVGATLALCVLGHDPFGTELDALEGREVGRRRITVHRKGTGEPLEGCQIVFLSRSAIGELPRLLEIARTVPVLIVADSAGAAGRGVALNMTVVQNKVTFEANLRTARGAGLALSSKLLRLATEVIQ